MDAGKIGRRVAALRSRADFRWSYSSDARIDKSGQIKTHPPVNPWSPYEDGVFQQIVTLEASIPTASVVAERRLVSQVLASYTVRASDSIYDVGHNMIFSATMGVLTWTTSSPAASVGARGVLGKRRGVQATVLN